MPLLWGYVREASRTAANEGFEHVTKSRDLSRRAWYAPSSLYDDPPEAADAAGDKAILEIIIRQLSAQGFDHITLAVNHQAEILMAVFGDGKKLSVKIDYSLETEPLGTMAPLRLVQDLPENFLVMNGDILTDLSYGAFLTRTRRTTG